MAIITGTNASQLLNGTNTPDTIDALGGSDLVDGLGDGDTISGGDGADTLRGGDGNDLIYGHSVADLDPNAGNITATLLANVGAGALALTGAPGDDGFVYALRKNTGDVIRINASTGVQSTFLDVPDSQFSTQSERGVLNLVFHPDYAANGRFFVYLTNPTGDIELREYARSGDPTIANATPVQTILTIPHAEFANHNGGSLAFGPDGNLYIGVGDGGSANDPDGNAQNINVLLGKILRIDVDGDDFPADASRNYAIPVDNPFAGATPGAGEIWAYGLRNPWRISFDPVTGDLYIGDVGQSAREEVNVEAAGGPGGLNYGWDFREGKLAGPSAPPVPPIAFTGPVIDYPRDVGQSITGGYVYRGPAAGLQGAYFYGDFISGRLMTLRMADGVAEDAIERTGQVVGADLSLISSFGTDNAGNLYVVTFSGAIYRLDPGIAAGDAADTIDGGAGDDALFGGVGNDSLSGGTGNDVLTGGVGADKMRGGAGDDIYVVDAGDSINESSDAKGVDTVRSSISFSLANSASLLGAVENLVLLGSGDLNGTGNALKNAIDGNDGGNILTGLAGNDAIQGFGGNDLLDGGTGNDVLKGGAGNDIYVIGAAGDKIDEEGKLDSADAVRSTISVDLNILGAGALEHATLTGAGAVNAIGNGAGNVLIGNKAANTLDGRGGADVMTGGDGADTYIVDHSSDMVTETNAAAAGGIDLVKSSVSFALTANLEKLTLTGTDKIDGTGNGLANIMLGNEGDNRLDGAAGGDTLAGGKGSDTYVVDSLKDVVNETIANSKGGGVDTVESTVAFSLATRANIENLTLLGSAAKGTGNALSNVITGNAAANVLDGGKGADVLTGGAGNDVYVIDTLADVIDEDGKDAGDEVRTSALLLNAIAGIEIYTNTGAKAWDFSGSLDGDTVNGGSGKDRLRGGDGNDLLFGNGGNDFLLGDIGDDLLDGGAGTDVMTGGAGNDTYVVNSVLDFADEADNTDANDRIISSVSFNLTAGIEHMVLTGTAALNATGNELDNTLTGNAGANKLDGGVGADTMTGGNGADTYSVDALGDLVVETNGGKAGGSDLVLSAIDYTLGANVEKLTLTGSGDIDGTGNSLNNTLTGNAGANILDGGTGNDAMTGGKGDDTYVVDAAGDVVNEAVAAGGGTDTVASSVTFSLATRVNVEDLTLTGSGAINGTGNALANHITGNDSDNRISGGGGNDVLAGGIGIDRLTGGAGRDVFDFDRLIEAGDTITDFKKGAAGDVLDIRGLLDDIGYGGSDAFSDGILTFDESGANTLVRVDADGGGAGSAITMATLLNVHLSEADTANYLVANS